MTDKIRIADVTADTDFAAVGRSMHTRAADLYPICRSITGDGVRATLRSLGEHIPITTSEVESGTAVFDWEVPKEWNISGGYIKDSKGNTICDFRDHNLHVVNYSSPIHATMSREALAEHIHTLPDKPDAIPYRTSYFKETWGFCLRHRAWEAMTDDKYEVCIESRLEPGHLSYGECVLPGETEDEFLISAHVCHPSLANDNLSGLVVATALAELLSKVNRRYTYRFVFAPGTIGAITWLSQNKEQASKIKHGLILACVGDRMATTYKQSRPGGAIDRAAEYVLRGKDDHSTIPFSPYGYDERQYGSPGFNLPIGCFMKSAPGQYAEYHSSDDNLALIKPEYLADSLEKCLSIIEVIEGNETYQNTNPHCEPMLGKRGLYGSTGGVSRKAVELAMLWVLNYSDGAHDLLDIAERSDMAFADIREAADLLNNAGLLERA